jgi:hypothetical protein
MGFSLVLLAAAVAATAPAAAAAAPVQPSTGDSATVAANQVAALVASRPAYLFASDNETFVQGATISSSGLHYVPFQRRYGSLPVVGGDFVMATNGAGQVISSSVAMTRRIGSLSLTPALSQAAAEAIASKQLSTVSGIESTQLVVNALGAAPRLAWNPSSTAPAPKGTAA